MLIRHNAPRGFESPAGHIRDQGILRVMTDVIGAVQSLFLVLLFSPSSQTHEWIKEMRTPIFIHLFYFDVFSLHLEKKYTEMTKIEHISVFPAHGNECAVLI